MKHTDSYPHTYVLLQWQDHRLLCERTNERAERYLLERREANTLGERYWHPVPPMNKHARQALVALGQTLRFQQHALRAYDPDSRDPDGLITLDLPAPEALLYQEEVNYLSSGTRLWVCDIAESDVPMRGIISGLHVFIPKAENSLLDDQGGFLLNRVGTNWQDLNEQHVWLENPHDRPIPDEDGGM